MKIYCFLFNQNPVFETIINNAVQKETNIVVKIFSFMIYIILNVKYH